MATHIAQKEVIQRLRDAGFRFSTPCPRVEIWRRPSDKQRVSVPRRDLIPIGAVRVILHQAGLTTTQIEQFLKDAITQDC